jgi:hypothetical protein
MDISRFKLLENSFFIPRAELFFLNGNPQNFEKKRPW